MNQAFHIQLVQLHEDAKRCDGAHGARELVAELVAHEVALEPCFHIARSLVSAALVGRAVDAELVPDRLCLGLVHDGGRHALLGLGLQAARLGRERTVQLHARRQRRHIARVMQDRLDGTVHEQIGVAPDRTGEVRVGRVCQAEVTDVVRAVDGLLHRAQQHGLQHRRVRARGDLLHQLRIVGRLGFIAATERQAARLQEGTQRLQLFFRGARMHTVQRRVLVLLEHFGGADIGRQHALLDQPVRVVARARQDLFDLALRVADDVRLGRVEVDRATLTACLEQRLIQLVQVLQMRDQRRPLGSLGALHVREDRPDLVVGQARLRMHHRRVELERLDLPLGGDDRIADHAQAIDLRVQRAQAVGELLRQHRDHAAREVDRSRAVNRIGVQRMPRPDVMRHVRNRHDQAPALAAADLDGLCIDGIVKVARVFTVDGHQRDVAQVDAAGQIGFAHHVGQCLCLALRRLRKLVRHAVLAHRDFDLHARVVDLTQHLDHAADRLHVAVRIFQDLHAHHLAHLGLALPLGRDQDVAAQALVFGRHHQRAVLGKQAADDAFVRPLQDLDDLAFGPATAVVANGPHEGAVTVHGLLHLALGQEDVGLAIVADEEAVAVAVADHAAFDEVGLVRQFVAPLAVEFDLTIPLHGGQTLDEAVMLLARDRQRLGNIGGRQRRSRRAQHTEDFLAARDRISRLIQFFLLEC
ncbi:hypothetical protein R76727_03343 [Ralstonia mannitolilytica]|nr:hypothetical protein R76727_03343 [Ralstonia mannitolilytica]